MAVNLIEISSDAALDLVPDRLLKFVCQLLVDTKLTEIGKDECSQQSLHLQLE